MFSNYFYNALASVHVKNISQQLSPSCRLTSFVQTTNFKFSSFHKQNALKLTNGHESALRTVKNHIYKLKMMLILFCFELLFRLSKKVRNIYARGDVFHSVQFFEKFIAYKHQSGNLVIASCGLAVGKIFP